MEWEREETVPEHVFQEFAKANMLIPSLPAPLPVGWLKRLGINDILGVVKVEDWDYLHMAIYSDEMARSGLAGPPGSLTTGISFGVPPILKFGSKDLQERFLPELLTGKKRTCIAITEPEAGSDVANIHTEARRSSDGKHYIVNGTKKWQVKVAAPAAAKLTRGQDNKRHLGRLCINGCEDGRTWPNRPLYACCATERAPRSYHAATQGSRPDICGHNVHRARRCAST